ncbi:TetR/AcrR family transcriptional regulator [Micromonospora olivasterospora]|uniref:TetR family transcriptional regulator n=1 Tax=Micromonospora olivasterospora TaxID=1880 RepID=A0A562IHM3_MICOL|nr:TetR/AcrR family transcriptional regulator C-terminal domain-containing protein [Micromonospora olivasterospora]TWH70243.1 TetR family transcriptional regulator [Micromonospora olivasterospora]
MSVIWERPAPARRGVDLDLERIVAAATAVADSEGLEAVTLRRVAADLGVLPMRLYTHLGTKDDLLDLMLDTAYGQVESPSGTDWREILTALARRLRAVAQRHPWLPRLMGARDPIGPHGLRLTEHVWQTLHALDPTPATAAARAAAFIGYVTGALQQQTGAPNDEQVRRYLAAAVAGGALPTLARVFAELTPTDTYELGLRVVLDGIGAAGGSEPDRSQGTGRARR